MSKKRITGLLVGLLIVVFAVLIVIGISGGFGGKKTKFAAASGILPDERPGAEGSYSYMYHQWITDGVTKNHSDRLQVTMDLGELELKDNFNGYQNKAVLLEKGDTITGKVIVKEKGLYAIQADYFNLNSSTLDNTISVKVNENYQFNEANKIILTQKYVSAEYPFRVDRNGNEIVPDTSQVEAWQQEKLKSITQGTTDCLLFYFEEGENEISFTMEQGSSYLGEITLVSPDVIPSYEEYVKQQPEGIKNGSEIYVIEAERVSGKNSTVPQTQPTRDIEVTPFKSNLSLMSTIGGKSWVKNGEALYYDVDIKESGWYKLSFKAKQNEKDNTYVYRTVTIDGKLPFSEAKLIAFPNTSKWQIATLGDDEKDYHIYLEKGKHTIGVEVDTSMLNGIVDHLTAISGEISDVSLQIRKIIGNNADSYRDWELLTYIPDLSTSLYRIADELEVIYADLVKINQGVTRNKELTSIKIAVDQLRKLGDDPDSIPNHMTILSEGTGSVGQTIGTLTEGLIKQPLLLDQIYLWQDGAKLPDYTVSFVAKASESFKYFLHSFSKDAQEKANKDEVVLDIWVNRARNYVDLLQKMADNDFTEKTGIRVNFSLMPNEQKLILANTTNTQPDIGMGISAFLPYDLAIRGALSDLRQFPGFSEVASQFSPGSLLTHTYDDGIYALPETQDFFVLFYRKDLLEGLEIPIPDTWDDVIKILPELQRFGMNFFTPLATSGSFKTFSMTLPFFLQNGASLYSDTGTEVVLNSEEGLKAMQFMTDLFTIYGLPSQVGDFYQQFRSGRIPIGISAFGTYLKIDAAASELAGAWDIAPMPGVKQADGTVARYATGSGTTSVVFKKSEHQEEAWEFMKWWLSAETQEEFGTQLELLYGSEYIWNTANLEAFSKMPLEEAHKEVILKQWEWLYEVPKTPASYMVEREISNIWNSIVFDGENPRSALDDGVVEMNREVARKLEEFGYIKNGVIVKNYKVPTIELIEGYLSGSDQSNNDSSQTKLNQKQASGKGAIVEDEKD